MKKKELYIIIVAVAILLGFFLPWGAIQSGSLSGFGAMYRILDQDFVQSGQVLPLVLLIGFFVTSLTAAVLSVLKRFSAEIVLFAPLLFLLILIINSNLKMLCSGYFGFYFTFAGTVAVPVVFFHNRQKS